MAEGGAEALRRSRLFGQVESDRVVPRGSSARGGMGFAFRALAPLRCAAERRAKESQEKPTPALAFAHTALAFLGFAGPEKPTKANKSQAKPSSRCGGRA
jgi:hypothetical protein